MKPFIGARAAIPRHMVTTAMDQHARKKLLFTSYSIDEIHKHISFAADEEDDSPKGHTETVNEYKKNKLARMVSVPRAWAVNAWPHLKFKDKTTFPKTVKHRNKVKARDAKQAKFFKELYAACMEDGPVDLLANAATGAGKSVAFVWLSLELQTPSLVIVDSNKLKNQYLRLMRKLMGRAWVKKHVGTIQQDTCDYEGKSICIAMVQSLASRKYPEEFYEHFGMVDFDEVQIFGAKHFSSVLSLFPARVRIGLTATNKKGDFGKIITSHLGVTRIRSKQEVLKPIVYIRKNRIAERLRFESDGALYTSLSRLRSRNERLAHIIKTRAYDRNRTILVLSDRIEQLQTLRKILIEKYGIPENAVGMHTGYYYTDRFDLLYKYGENGKHTKLSTFDTYSKARTAYNRLSRLRSYDQFVAEFGKNHPICKSVKQGKTVFFKTAREQYKPSESELDNITNFCNIIHATYKIFQKGVDVPRIDMGLEALPIGNVTQPLGRTLRLLEGKLKPEWVSFHDQVLLPEDATPQDAMIVNSLNKWFNAKAAARMRGFEKSGAEIRVQG